MRSRPSSQANSLFALVAELQNKNAHATLDAVQRKPKLSAPMISQRTNVESKHMHTKHVMHVMHVFMPTLDHR